MNTKVAIGIIVAIILLVVAFFALNHKPAPAVFTPTTATTTGATSTTTTKTAPISVSPGVQDTHKPTITVLHKAAFNKASLVSTSPRPVLTGTASVSNVGMVITNSAGVGISGSSQIPVKNGAWTYSAPEALAPGTYTLSLIVDSGDIVTATLTVKGS